MNNNGCFMALLSSVKVLRANIEQARCQIDGRVYDRCMEELQSMEKFMTDIMRGPDISRNTT